MSSPVTAVKAPPRSPHKRKISPLSAPTKRKRGQETPISPRLQPQRSIKSSSPQASLCHKHQNCTPISRLTFAQTVTAIRSKVSNAAETICLVEPKISTAWLNGYSELMMFCGGGEWDECTLCTIVKLILSCARLPLMMGLYILGRYEEYSRCLEVLEMYESKEFSQIVDGRVREFVKVHQAMS